MGKILFNIFIVYLIWQFLRMFFAVKKVQKGFSEQMNDLNQKVNQQNTSQNSQKASSQKEKNDEGEYVDFEEIK